MTLCSALALLFILFFFCSFSFCLLCSRVLLFYFPLFSNLVRTNLFFFNSSLLSHFFMSPFPFSLLYWPSYTKRADGAAQCVLIVSERLSVSPTVRSKWEQPGRHSLGCCMKIMGWIRLWLRQASANPTTYCIEPSVVEQGKIFQLEFKEKPWFWLGEFSFHSVVSLLLFFSHVKCNHLLLRFIHSWHGLFTYLYTHYARCTCVRIKYIKPF